MSKQLKSYLFEWRNVVLLAETHNPSLLNPDFLKRNNIISKDWEVTETFTTPPLSVVRFNKISITIDQNRLQIQEDISHDALPENTYIYDITSKFIKLIEFVNYKSLGINWSINIPNENAEQWIITNLLGNNIKNKFIDSLKSLKMTLSLELTSSILNLAISPKNINLNEFKGNVINFNANYSHIIPQEYIGKKDGINYINENISKWKEKERALLHYINNIISE